MKELTINELHKLMDRDEIILLDVREAEEYDAGHLPKAQSMPLSQIELWGNRLEQNTPYAVICHSGKRSEQACYFLEERGLLVYNVLGGTLAFTGGLEIKRSLLPTNNE